MKRIPLAGLTQATGTTTAAAAADVAAAAATAGLSSEGLEDLFLVLAFRCCNSSISSSSSMES